LEIFVAFYFLALLPNLLDLPMISVLASKIVEVPDGRRKEKQSRPRSALIARGVKIKN
jgi:hypothetical protein